MANGNGNGSTKTTLGSIAALVGLIGGIAAIFLPMNGRQETIGTEVRDLRVKMDRIEQNRFTDADGKETEERLRSLLSNHASSSGHPIADDKIGDLQEQVARLDERTKKLEETK